MDIVYTVEETCVGCNKCIRHCPVFGANISYIQNGQNKVRVDQDRCIRCGACIEVCSHEARQYADDTERFFSDLEKGLPVSVVAAPAARTNFDDYRKLLGFLKQQGVRLVYDVSFGADITTWAYLKAIQQQNRDSVIAQPCPAIVNYIEKYQSTLLPKLAPVHSPTLCAAIYLNKYESVSDRIAFLSPCIGKIDEFTDRDSGNYVHYNVTYSKLADYLDRKKIDLSQFPGVEYDNPECWLGCLYSRPGGLRENVEALTDNAWVRQVEGPDHAYSYLNGYQKRIKENKPLPLLVDILNCSHGCNVGTGTCKHITIDDADVRLNGMKREKNESRSIFDYFNETLRLEDFLRGYTDRSVTLRKPSERELDEVYRSLHKYSALDRRIDCSACGYATCYDMALAIFNGFNTTINCIRFNQHEIEIEAEKIRENTVIIEELSGYTNKVVSVLDRIAELNLNVSVEGEFKGEFAKIKESINTIVFTLNNTLNEIQRSADQFSAGAEELARASDTLASGTEDQARAVGTLSSLLGMMTDQAKKNAANAEEAKKLSVLARESAEEGNGSMGEMLTSMKEIAESSSAIASILKAIDDIAFQTNILALNAAIEAARAGKYGKGFSVVADEVRSLAARCSAAAKESSQRIHESEARVDIGTKVAHKTARALEEIVTRSTDIAKVVEDIARISGEQSQGIDDIHAQVQQVSTVVQSNAASSQQSANTSKELFAEASELKKRISSFTLSEAMDEREIQEIIASILAAQGK